VGIACCWPTNAPTQHVWRDAYKLNEDRREIEQRMQLEAIDVAAGLRLRPECGETFGRGLFDESWHQGVEFWSPAGSKPTARPVMPRARRRCFLGRLRGAPISGVNIPDALDTIATRHQVSSTNSAATPWRRD